MIPQERWEMKHTPQVIRHKSQIDNKVGIQIVWGWWEGDRSERDLLVNRFLLIDAKIVNRLQTK